MIDLHENDYGPLRTRMDTDYAMAMLLNVVTEDSITKKKYDFPVMLNDAKTFIDRCFAIINADRENYEITGVDATVQKKLEEFYKLCLYINDEQLALRGISALKSDINWMNLYRGWLGSLWLLYDIGGKYIPSIVASDTRGMTWEYGSRGLKQFSYPARMLKEEAEEKFKKTLKDIGKGKFVDLKCVWTDTHELVYQSGQGNIGIQGDPLNEEGKGREHKMGICPGVITEVPTEPSARVGEDDYPTKLSRRGESVMAPNRPIYPMLIKVACVLGSVMMQGWKAPVVLKSDNTEGFEQNPNKPGKIAQIAKEDDMMLMPYRDLTQSLQYFQGMLSTNKQKGGLSDINYGQLDFQVASLVVAQLKDDRDGIFVPRRMANKSHYRQGFNIFRQMIKNGKFYPGDPGALNADDAIGIDKTLFEKKFVINIDYTSISPEENITNHTIAGQAKSSGLYPKIKILSEILHDSDPAGTLREIAMEEQEDINPLLKMYRAGIAKDPDRLTQKQIDDDEFLIIMDGIKQQLNSPQPLNALAGMASTPKPDFNKATPEKVAQKRLNQSGQMNAINGKRSLGG